MSGIFVFLAAAAASAPQAALPPPPAPDWAATMEPITTDELRRYAHVLVAFAARAGGGAGQAQWGAGESAAPRIGAAERAKILGDNHLSPARFDHIAAQVRHSERMARVVREELQLAATHAL